MALIHRLDPPSWLRETPYLGALCICLIAASLLTTQLLIVNGRGPVRWAAALIAASAMGGGLLGTGLVVRRGRRRAVLPARAHPSPLIAPARWGGRTRSGARGGFSGPASRYRRAGSRPGSIVQPAVYAHTVTCSVKIGRAHV